MVDAIHAKFSSLSREEALAMLARHHFGRLAFAFHDRVDIEPISYTYEDEWLYARTSPGAKLTTVHHQPWVAFEVDEIENVLSWKSVVAHGALYILDPARGPSDRGEYESALKVLRSADPHVLASSDPVPHRDVLIRIHVDEVTGRQASPG